MKNLKKGFTLIELLVVVAIIGILASVVLASLNTARAKGSDAAVKANLDNMRAEAAIYYDSNSNAYAAADNGAAQAITTANTCATAAGALLATAGTASTGDVTFCNGLVAAALASSSTAYVNVLKQSWVAGANLKATATTWWCVDSSGASKLESSAFPSAATWLTYTVCP
jgi:prepilin-type N-terminal cleavage/methylation domain-containing protein